MKTLIKAVAVSLALAAGAAHAQHGRHGGHHHRPNYDWVGPAIVGGLVVYGINRAIEVDRQQQNPVIVERPVVVERPIVVDQGVYIHRPQSRVSQPIDVAGYACPPGLAGPWWIEYDSHGRPYHVLRGCR